MNSAAHPLERLPDSNKLLTLARIGPHPSYDNNRRLPSVDCDARAANPLRSVIAVIYEGGVRP